MALSKVFPRNRYVKIFFQASILAFGLDTTQNTTVSGLLFYTVNILMSAKVTLPKFIIYLEESKQTNKQTTNDLRNTFKMNVLESPTLWTKRVNELAKLSIKHITKIELAKKVGWQKNQQVHCPLNKKIEKQFSRRS